MTVLLDKATADADDVLSKTRLREKLREEGNTHFKNNSYNEAYKKYMMALGINHALCGSNIASQKNQAPFMEVEDQAHILLSNIAAALLKLNRNEEALEYAKISIKRKESFVKGYIRCAKAYENLKQMQEAALILTVGLKSCSDSCTKKEQEIIQRMVMKYQTMSTNIANGAKREIEETDMVAKNEKPARKIDIAENKRSEKQSIYCLNSAKSEIKNLSEIVDEKLGYSCPLYSWSQNDYCVKVSFPVAKHIPHMNPQKHLKCIFSTKKLFIKIINPENGQHCTLIDEELEELANEEEGSWSIRTENGKDGKGKQYIDVIIMKKQRDVMWQSVFFGHPTINDMTKLKAKQFPELDSADIVLDVHTTIDGKISVQIGFGDFMLSDEEFLEGDSAKLVRLFLYFGVYEKLESNTDNGNPMSIGLLSCDIDFSNRKVFVGGQASDNKVIPRTIFEAPYKPGTYQLKGLSLIDDSFLPNIVADEILIKKTHRARIMSPPYLLIKEVNLLCYLLYLPLDPFHKMKKKRLRSSGPFAKTKIKYRIPAKKMTHSPDPRLPSMKLQSQNKKLLSIYYPKRLGGDAGGGSRAEAFELDSYLQVHLHDAVDLDRSTLTWHDGNFLVARLSFAEMSSASRARNERSLLHPRTSELMVESYSNGIYCRSCGNKISTNFKYIGQAPFSPWLSILSNLTCVSPEEYMDNKDADVAFGLNKIEASSERPLLDQAYIQVHSDCIKRGNIVTCSELEDTRGDYICGKNEYEEEKVQVSCSRCNGWLGLAIATRNKTWLEGEGNEPFQVRYFKHAITTTLPAQEEDGKNEPISSHMLTDNIFSHYTSSSCTVIGSLISRGSLIDENYRFLVKSPDNDVSLHMLLWSRDSWTKTEQDEALQPAMKVLFRENDPEDEIFLEEAEIDSDLWSQAEIIHLPLMYVQKLVDDLNASNMLLPFSARIFQNGMKMGFLQW